MHAGTFIDQLIWPSVQRLEPVNRKPSRPQRLPCRHTHTETHSPTHNVRRAAFPPLSLSALLDIFHPPHSVTFTLLLFGLFGLFSFAYFIRWAGRKTNQLHWFKFNINSIISENLIDCQ